MAQIISIIVLILFFILIVYIGVFSKKKAETVDGFLLGGRKIGPWLSAFAYGTTYFSAVIFVGYAGMFGWNIGFGGMWIGIANGILGCLLAWYVLAKPTRRMTHKLGVRTVPELLEGRYLSRGMKLYAAIIIFIFLVPYAASVYKGLGALFSAIFPGASPTTCITIVAVITAIYLVLGGYVATALNDFIQGVIMVVGLLAMIAIVVSRPEVGGIVEGATKLAAMNPELTNFFSAANFKTLLPNILLTSFGVWGMPQMVHKFYAIKDDSSIKSATVISTIFCLFIGLGAYFNGSLARLFVPVAANGTPDVPGGFDGAVPTMLMTVLSEGVFQNIILGLIMLLLFSASMSTLSGVVLSSSSAISIDLVQEINPNVKPKSQLLIMRTLCLIFIACSFVFATMNISFIVNLMSFSWGVVAGSFIGPYIWGIYCKWITKAGAWAGLLSGLLVVGVMLIYNTAISGFDAAKALAPIMGVSAMGVSLVAVPLVSLITKKYDSAHTDYVFAEETAA